MSNQERFSLVSKPLNNTKYHLATFNARISQDDKLPKHILEEYRQVRLQYKVILCLSVGIRIKCSHRHQHHVHW